MSAKNDADNHSNQLNPNNDAYYDSRGVDRDGYDDDGTDSDDGYLSNASRMVAFEMRQRIDAMEASRNRVISQTYTLDFLSFDDRSLHIQFSAATRSIENEMGQYRTCRDIIEAVLPSLKSKFERTAGTPIACLWVRNSIGNEMLWLCDEYKPSEPSLNDNADRKAHKLKFNEMWERGAKQSAATFIRFLRRNAPIERSDIGTVTPASVKNFIEIVSKN